MSAGLATRLAAALGALALAGSVAAAGLVAETPRPLPAPRHARLAEALAQRDGSPVLINFWASWCEPCRGEMPALQRLADRWRKRGLAVLTVAVADPGGQAGSFLWDVGVTLPVLEDPEQAVARAWAVGSLPTTLVLDRRHRLVARARGAVDWDARAVDAQLKLWLE